MKVNRKTALQTATKEALSRPRQPWVEIELCPPILGSRRIININNLYGSPQLFEQTARMNYWQASLVGTELLRAFKRMTFFINCAHAIVLTWVNNYWVSRNSLCKYVCHIVTTRNVFELVRSLGEFSPQVVITNVDVLRSLADTTAFGKFDLIDVYRSSVERYVEMIHECNQPD